MEVKGNIKVQINLNLPKSWKTSLFSVITAACSFVMFADRLGTVHFPPWVMTAVLFINSGALAAFGFSAKDADVTGGTTAATPEASARIANQVAPHA
jgi:hypothetical protein